MTSAAAELRGPAALDATEFHGWPAHLAERAVHAVEREGARVLLSTADVIALDVRGALQCVYRDAAPSTLRRARAALAALDPAARPARELAEDWPPWLALAASAPAAVAPERWHAWTDGSGTRHDQLAAVGVVVLRGAAVVREVGEAIGRGSNNTAEAWAIGRALQLVEQLAGTRDVPVTVHSDSAWALGAVDPACTWRLSAKRSARVAMKVRALCATFPRLAFEHVAGHSGLEWNERADKLAGDARKAAVAAAGSAAQANAGGT